MSKTARPAEAQLRKLEDLLQLFQQDAAAAHEARLTGEPRGPVTGFPKLDRELSGALLPGLHFIHGQPGTGKTAFALQVAAQCQCAALFVTCEMSPLELLRRHTARVTGTYLGRLKSGEFRPDDVLEKARQAVQEAPQLFILDATRGIGETKKDLQPKAETIRRMTPHFLMVVDSLHTWTQCQVADTQASEYEALNSAIRTLQTLASAWNCPILIVSERNRDSMEKGGMSAGAGTRKIEYQGETVISLERTKESAENSNGEVEVKAHIVKNRHGSPGKKVNLLFHGALQRFREDGD